MYDLINCAFSNECVEAFQKPMPGTRATSAFINLLTSSIPGEFAWEITTCPSACDALIWISNKFQGVYNRAINGEWFRRFTQEGMTREETLKQCVQRKAALYRSLEANHHPMHPDDLQKYIIEGLLPEFNSSRTSLYAPCAGGTADSILQVLRLQAHGIHFNDQRPRPDPKAATTTVAPQQRQGKQSGTQGRGRPRCWECGKHGHIAKDCPNWKKDSSTGKEEPLKPQPTCVQTTTSNPLVTHNVLSSCNSSYHSEEWLIDSGASVHLKNDMSMLQNMAVFSEPRVLQLATAGAKGRIIATGSVRLLNHEGRST